MTLLTLFTTAYLTLVPGRAGASPAIEPAASVAATDEVQELKRRLKQVTAEADALWIYVQSGPENPDVAALNRAAALYDRRRPRR